MAAKACPIFRVLPFSFSIVCTAMFAEPTIPEIEKVVGLLHEGTVASGSQVSGAGLIQLYPAPDMRGRFVNAERFRALCRELLSISLERSCGDHFA